MKTLLFDGHCAVCRSIGDWVTRSAKGETGASAIVARPIGDDPRELRSINPALGIWDAYATIHIVMPDGSMKLGGEAVAEVFRSLPNTRWFAWIFALHLFGFRPFQGVLDLGYVILADIRPLLGCESCGTSNVVVRTLEPFVNFIKVLARGRRHHTPRPLVRIADREGRRYDDPLVQR